MKIDYLKNFNPDTGEVEIYTNVTVYPFINKDKKCAVSEFWLILSQQIFLCLLSNEEDEIIEYPENDISIIVTTVDGINIDFTCYGKIYSDESFYELYLPINLKNLDIDVKIDGLSISVSSPQEIINRNWAILSKKAVSNIKLKDENGLFIDFIPNPDSDDVFPAKNVFIEHLKTIYEAKNL
jgi:hypothetical protein